MYRQTHAEGMRLTERSERETHSQVVGALFQALLSMPAVDLVGDRNGEPLLSPPPPPAPTTEGGGTAGGSRLKAVAMVVSEAGEPAMAEMEGGTCEYGVSRG